MTNNDYNNGHAANDDFTGFTYELEEPIAVKGFSVTYDGLAGAFEQNVTVSTPKLLSKP